MAEQVGEIVYVKGNRLRLLAYIVRHIYTVA